MYRAIQKNTMYRAFQNLDPTIFYSILGKGLKENKLLEFLMNILYDI